MKWLTVVKYGGGILGGLALAWIFYAGLIRPTTKPVPTTTNNADTIVNLSVAPRVSFGCANFRLMRGDGVTSVEPEILKAKVR